MARLDTASAALISRGVSDSDTMDEAILRGGELLAFHFEGKVNDSQKILSPRSVEEIQRDPSLQEWREGVPLCIVSVILDNGSPRRIGIAVDYGLLQAIVPCTKRPLAAGHREGIRRVGLDA